MGCQSSTPIAVKDEKTTKAVHHQHREKNMTGGTEIMTTAHNTAGSPTFNHHNEHAAASPEVISTATTHAVLGEKSLKVRYACQSRRGRDPDDASKPNQDSYSVHQQLHNKDALFGVYDGHGPHGQECSQFVQTRLPQLLKSNLKKNAPDLYQMSLHDAHVECNDELRSSDINDWNSGTTCITLYVHGDEHVQKLTICNVGDSRAVMGTPTSSTGLTAVALSKDQTPKRADEATRCRQSGARILTFGEIDPSQEAEDDDDGVEDPPRVWSKQGNFPGVAFTRSIGDAAAKQLGVICEPEQLSLKISPAEVKIIVLASDGVFDVMSNQEVIDLCYQHYPHDPMQACSAVVAKSFTEWHVNDDCGEGDDDANYDDMTIICIFVEDEHDGNGVAENGHATASTSTAIRNKEDAKPCTTSPEERPKKRVRHKQKTLRNLEEMQE